MTAPQWQAADEGPEGRLVLTKVHDAYGIRNVMRLARIGGVWVQSLDNHSRAIPQPTHWMDA